MFSQVDSQYVDYTMQAQRRPPFDAMRDSKPFAICPKSSPAARGKNAPAHRYRRLERFAYMLPRPLTVVLFTVTYIIITEKQTASHSSRLCHMRHHHLFSRTIETSVGP